MEARRIFLYLALGLIVILIWVNWRSDHAPKPAAKAPVPATAQVASKATVTPPSVQTTARIVAVAPSATTAPVPAARLQAPSGPEVTVRTDVLELTLSTDGGALTRADLLKYPRTLHSRQPVALLSPKPKHFLVAEPLLASKSLPQRLKYTSEKASYQLAPGSRTVTVPLVWKGKNATVKRVFVFARGSYEVRVRTTITNDGGETRRFSPAMRLVGRDPPTPQHIWDRFLPKHWSYRGPSYFNGDYHKRSVDSLTGNPLDKSFTGGWIASVDQYFDAVAIPNGKLKAHYFGHRVGNAGYAVGYRLPSFEIPPGASKTLAMKLYLGPKLQGHLNQAAPGLSRTVDYGKMTIICVPIFWLLSNIESGVGNWGWSIILLVLLIKAVFYFPQRMSARSMAKMRKLQPRMKLLKERYKDDKQKLSQATMKLYREEGANPVSGCLPMLIQLPIFFGLFYVLIYSVELRHAPWVLWLQDLSAPGPFYILPILYAVAMLVQFRLQPQSADNAQAKMMMIMPFGMAFLYAIFPSGLVLYYLLNTLLNIAIQWQVNRELHVPMNIWPEDLWPRKKRNVPEEAADHE